MNAGGLGLVQGRRRSLSAFISYAHESDTGFSIKLGEKLRARGIEPKDDWLLTPGPSYRDQISALIRDSDVFIAVISRLSVISPAVRSEIDQANGQKKKLLPVRIDDYLDEAALHQALRLPQWTLLRPIDSFETGFTSLVDAINTDFDLMVVHTWLTQRAAEWDTHGRRTSALLSGRELKEAEDWLPKVSANQLQLPNVTPLQADFILECQRARTRRARWVAGITLAIVAALSVLTIYAFEQRRIARKNERTAEENARKERIARKVAEEEAKIAESRRLAAQSSFALKEHPQQSLLLAVEGLRVVESLPREKAFVAEDSLT